uniref:Uncharacterized protein n=1 Tax=Cacopsylla melanoneura TaxID=428564 RepID=A0A8D8T8V8_9HEMI
MKNRQLRIDFTRTKKNDGKAVYLRDIGHVFYTSTCNVYVYTGNTQLFTSKYNILCFSYSESIQIIKTISLCYYVKNNCVPTAAKYHLHTGRSSIIDHSIFLGFKVQRVKRTTG